MRKIGMNAKLVIVSAAVLILGLTFEELRCVDAEVVIRGNIQTESAQEESETEYPYEVLSAETVDEKETGVE